MGRSDPAARIRSMETETLRRAQLRALYAVRLSSIMVIVSRFLLETGAEAGW